MSEAIYMMVCSVVTTIAWLVCLVPFFELKDGKKKGWVLLAVVYLVHDYYWGRLGESPWECLVAYTLYAVIFHKFFKGRLLQKMSYAFALNFLLQICGMTVEMIAALFFVGFDMEAVVPYLMGMNLRVLCFVTAALIPGAFLAIALFRMMKHLNQKFVNCVALLLWGVDVSALIWDNPQCIQLIFPAFFVFLLGNLYMQNRMNKQMREQFAYYSRIDEFEEKQREQLGKLRHDMANHIGVVENLENQQSLPLADYEDNMIEHTTGNKVVDCLLYMKENDCREKEIKFDCKITSLKEMKAKEFDMVSLFANLFDNAIEACERSNGEKSILFSMERQENYLVILLENSKNPEDAPIKNEFATIKSFKEGHGLGTKIIKEITEKYNGYVKYEDLLDSMKLEIRICIY